MACRRDHPRVCGEHTCAEVDGADLTGSSPRMRGTRSLFSGQFRARGIIPAYAGNTLYALRVSGFHWDHPRVCGEHPPPPPEPTEDLGSSPRMRGTRRLHRLLRGRPGIIPAYAGNTVSWPRSTIQRRDHPRVCGEHLSTVAVSDATTGSSPRMRGTQIKLTEQRPRLGIIPAYAGNTFAFPA